MTINLSTRLFYDRATFAMQSLTARADTINTQVATGKKLLAASDDSAGYQRLQGVRRATADNKTDAANVTLAQAVLQQADTALGALGDQLQRASELTVRAGNGSNSAEERAAIAGELSEILASIVALANAGDVRGGPLFGGASGDEAVTKNADGALGFAAGEGAAIPIGDGQTVQPSSNARNFLGTANGDIGSAITAIVAALRNGDAVPVAAVADLKTVSDQVTQTRASLGARAARVDLQAGQLKAAAADREVTRAGIEDVDVTEAITELQKTMTILSATQASFSKLSQLSLFDYLR